MTGMFRADAGLIHSLEGRIMSGQCVRKECVALPDGKTFLDIKQDYIAVYQQFNDDKQMRLWQTVPEEKLYRTVAVYARIHGE